MLTRGGHMAGRCLRQATGLAGLLLVLAGCTSASQIAALVVPEQRSLDIRDYSQLPQAPLATIPPPETVSSPSAPEAAAKQLSLDEAIQCYERGAQLKLHCERKLNEAQQRVDRIVIGPDGSIGAEPMKLGQ